MINKELLVLYEYSLELFKLFSLLDIFNKTLLYILLPITAVRHINSTEKIMAYIINFKEYRLLLTTKALDINQFNGNKKLINFILFIFESFSIELIKSMDVDDLNIKYIRIIAINNDINVEHICISSLFLLLIDI